MTAAAVAAGGEHSVILTQEGDLLTVGACGAGWKYDLPYVEEVLRASAARCRALPRFFAGAARSSASQVRVPSNGAGAEIDAGRGSVPRISAGNFHNLLLVGGRLFAWGCDSIDENDGQLGLGSRAETPTPAPVLRGVVDAAAGAHHSLAVTAAGELLSSGAGTLGQLGRSHDYTTDPREVPAPGAPSHAAFAPVATAAAEGRVVRCAAGYYHSLALTSRGRLLCFGSNSHGQCGARAAGDRAHASGDDVVPAPRCVQGLATARMAAADGGYSHTLLVTEEGDVWTCGGNDGGQRGVPGTNGSEQLPPCTRVDVGGPAAGVAAGYAHSVVLRRDGKVVTFGENGSGQLGLPGGCSAEPRVVPLEGHAVEVAAGNEHTVVRLADGSVLSWGSGRNGQQAAGDLADVRCPAPLSLEVE